MVSVGRCKGCHLERCTAERERERPVSHRFEHATHLARPRGPGWAPWGWYCKTRWNERPSTRQSDDRPPAETAGKYGTVDRMNPLVHSPRRLDHCRVLKDLSA